MSRPKLTIGMATYDDYNGVWFTLQAIRMFTPRSVLKDIELLVVDQNPQSEHGAHTFNAVRNCQAGMHSVKYVPYTERIGTSPSRDMVFRQAEGRIVCCVDAHVFIQPGGIEALLEYFDFPLPSKDIVSGPILHDGLYRGDNYGVMATHYADHIREEMWGIWASAWQCSCGKFMFAPHPEGNICRYETVAMNPQEVKHCPKCNKKLPLIDFGGHEGPLAKAGYVNLGEQGKEPFEVPGQGLGLFAMLKESWVGFHAESRGFGGEELYVHEKVRRAGGKAICHPGIKWLHRFGRPGGAAYPNSQWYKARNYVLEMLDLGRDIKPFRDHFINERGFPVHEWEALVSDPLKFVHGPTERHIQPTNIGGKLVNNIQRDINDVYEVYAKAERDLNQHFPLIRDLASSCPRIVAFTKRKEWDVAILAAQPNHFVSHNVETDSLFGELKALRGKCDYTLDQVQSSGVEKIEDCDMLVIDTVHHADRLRGELAKFGQSVSHYIVLRGTGAFGIQAEGGGPGLWDAVREFVKANPQWFVSYHTNNQYGMTVLSCDPNDTPPQKLIPWPPGVGPGTSLKKMLTSLGIQDVPNCGCTQYMIQMDVWGVAGCRERFNDIVKHLEDNADKWGWSGRLTDDLLKPTILKAAFKAICSGLAFKIDPRKPFQGLVTEAIRLAEKDCAQCDGKTCKK